MKTACYGYLFILSATLLVFSLPFEAQTVKNKLRANNSTETLRQLYFKRDFEGCAEAGQHLSAKYSANVEANAWLIVCQSRGTEQREAALQSAQKLAAENPTNGWAWFALANAQLANQKNNDAPVSAAKALEIEPFNEEFILTKTQVLSTQRKYDDAGIYLESNSAKIKDKSRLAYTRALILYNRSKAKADKPDESLRKQSFDNFAEAVKLAPQSVSANYLYGAYSNIDKNYSQAYLPLKKAVALSPKVLEIRREFWQAVSNQPDKNEAQKSAEITADINNFLAAQNNSPAALAAVSQKYGELKNAEQQAAYENQILQKYGDTKYAEEILYSRIQAQEIESSKKVDPAKIMEMLNKVSSGNSADLFNSKDYQDFQKQLLEGQNKLKAMRWEYVKRPQHFDNDKLGDTYDNLIQQTASDRNVTDEQLLEVITGALNYRVKAPIRYYAEGKLSVKSASSVNVNSSIARSLVLRRFAHPDSSLNKDAEKYARAGIVEAEDKITEMAKTVSNQETLASRAKALRVKAKEVLGSVLLSDKKYREAEKELLEAAMLDDTDLSVNADLAHLYEEQKNFDKAEGYYLKNASGTERDRNTFSKLYKTRNGNLEGFDAYYAGIMEKIHNRAKETVYASRIKNPKDAMPFSLTTIDGKTISLADLKGKITVINFWGTWCAPCVMEMPELHQLYKKYENDKDVAIITMDSNDELETVKKFIADKKYEFPVLLGDSYTSNIIINGGIAFPTTLFIDKEGKVSYQKVGRTEHLLEEFGWRIEALKESK